EVSVAVNGILINPDLQHLDPQVWISETDAIERAIVNLRSAPHSSNRAASLDDLAKDRKIRGELHVDIEQTSSGLAVRPIYRVRGDGADAFVNMLDGVTEIRVRHPRSRPLPSAY
ncbi:MAG: hypothetical protein AAGI44_04115, partial [Pseudomonadota bacterium]